MTDKKKDDKLDTSKSASPDYKEPAQTNKLPDEKDLNPGDELKEQIEQKDQDEKTPQEEFVEGQQQVKEYRDAASVGGPTPGGGPTGAAAGLAVDKADPKDIDPPKTDETLLDEDEDDEESDKSNEEEVEFEPVPDPKARMHGTHDAAMAGLQTDVSGTYTPPGIVKSAQDRQAEEQNQERARRAQDQQAEFAVDTGGCRNRL